MSSELWLLPASNKPLAHKWPALKLASKKNFSLETNAAGLGDEVTPIENRDVNEKTDALLDDIDGVSGNEAAETDRDGDREYDREAIDNEDVDRDRDCDTFEELADDEQNEFSYFVGEHIGENCCESDELGVECNRCCCCCCCFCFSLSNEDDIVGALMNRNELENILLAGFFLVDVEQFVTFSCL